MAKKRLTRLYSLCLCAAVLLIVWMISSEPTATPEDVQRDSILQLRTRQGQLTNSDSVPRVVRGPLPVAATTKPERIHRRNRTTKHVLLYTGLLLRRQWYGQTEAALAAYTIKANCPVSECTFAYDVTSMRTFDAVVFHYVDIPHRSPKETHDYLDQLNRVRPAYQRWVFFIHEPPFHFTIFPFDVFNGYFNWTMSYARSSDVPLTYFTTAPNNQDGTATQINNNYAQGKNRLVAFASSHCGVFRDNYVMELQKYVSVTVFGKCANQYKQRGECERGTQACLNYMKQFKFYLAFESQFCHDYITEKYWENSLKAGLVPVVMGANYDGVNAVPGSYIDVSDFASIQQLADYLLYLDKNDTAYNEYFKWRQTHTIVHNDMFCKLCEELHNDKHPEYHVYDVKKFWSDEKQCAPFIGRKQQLAKQISMSREARRTSPASA